MLREKAAELSFLQGSMRFISSTECKEPFTIALNYVEVGGCNRHFMPCHGVPCRGMWHVHVY